MTKKGKAKPTVTIELSIDDALDAGIAISLAEYISRARFPSGKCYRIGNIFLKAVSKVMKEADEDGG